MRQIDFIDFENFEVNKKYVTPFGIIEIVHSSYYGKKDFYILTLDNQTVATYNSLSRAIQAAKRLTNNKKGNVFWLWFY